MEETWCIERIAPRCPHYPSVVHVTRMSGKATNQMRWEGRSPAGCDTLPMFDALVAQGKGDRLWKRL